MKRKFFAGTTSVALPIFALDATAAGPNNGLAGLVYNTASLVAEYRRQGQSSWTAITLVAGTLGTYTSGGIVADGALAGAYEFCPPDAAFAAGARWVAIRLRGAANMGAVLIECELDAVNYQDAFGFGLLGINGLAVQGAASGSPTATAVPAAAGLSAADGFYSGAFLLFTSGANKGLGQKVTGYVGSTRTFATQAFPTAPAAGDTFVVLGRVPS